MTDRRVPLVCRVRQETSRPERQHELTRSRTVRVEGTAVELQQIYRILIPETIYGNQTGEKYQKRKKDKKPQI